MQYPKIANFDQKYNTSKEEVIIVFFFLDLENRAFPVYLLKKRSPIINQRKDQKE